MICCNSLTVQNLLQWRCVKIKLIIYTKMPTLQIKRKHDNSKYRPSLIWGVKVGRYCTFCCLSISIFCCSIKLNFSATCTIKQSSILHFMMCKKMKWISNIDWKMHLMIKFGATNCPYITMKLHVNRLCAFFHRRFYQTL
jgi:hypothetical protein